MAIPFKVIAKANPSDRSLPERFFGNAQVGGEATLRDLANRISSMSTLTTIDTLAVLEAFVQVIPGELTNGRIVRLGDFGSLRVLLQSQGSDTPEEFTSSLINQARVRFRPGRLIQNALDTATFQRVE